ncbi:MAG: hypothetical protein M3362_03115 [Acidobacteriota bacterium]|nr:hypothetical protein [Acidobacteriota bacterium]
MVTFLITAFLLLAGITYVIYRGLRPSSNREAEYSLPPPPRAVGLFEEKALREARARELESAENLAEEERQALLSRATKGDKRALDDANAKNDAALYDEVLNLLIEGTGTDASLLALVSYIARSDAHLRVNRHLAEKFIEVGKRSPDRNQAAKMLHVAALSDDASTYQSAIETVYQFWRDRKLKGVTATELRQLMESEFWLLSPAQRNSGAGFLLKRKLAHLRRTLAAERERL